MNQHLPLPRDNRLRRLSAEEIELWLEVTRSVQPRPGSSLPALKAVPPREAPAPSAPIVEASSVTPELAPRAASRPVHSAPASLERRLRQKLARGRAAPDAAIDLHGLSAQEAFLALRRFLVRAQASGARLVLVVTGKGERFSPNDTAGVLRKSVPHWLASCEFHALVAGFEEAARPHGGTGALYVKLRRRDRALRSKTSP